MIFSCYDSMAKKNLKKFLEFRNCYHPTIKFTADYSREEIHFLDVPVRKTNNQLVTDLYIKPTDTRQYLHASSCHVYHSKKSIPYSQALRLNRICSENSSYDKRCNEIEVWLRGGGGTVINWLDNKFLRPLHIRERTF